MTYNNLDILKAVESKRRLLLQKDLFELQFWMADIENAHTELHMLSIIEAQFLKKNTVTMNIQGARRKNTLLMGTLCKYEQSIKVEIEYGKTDYDIKRSKIHEKQRDAYRVVMCEFRAIKSDIYKRLVQLYSE